MSSNIQVGSPILKGFVYNSFSVGNTAWTKVLDAVDQTNGSKKRAILTVQSNATGTDTIKFRFDLSTVNPNTGPLTDGHTLKAGELITVDNYNGTLWAKADVAGPLSFTTAENFA